MTRPMYSMGDALFSHKLESLKGRESKVGKVSIIMPSRTQSLSTFSPPPLKFLPFFLNFLSSKIGILRLLILDKGKEGTINKICRGF